MADTSSDYCALCYGDRWISDSMADYDRCTLEEQIRFVLRIGMLGGAAEGRMACPRCLPNWKPAPRRAQSIADFEKWLLSKPALVAAVKRELRGKDLLCWCHPLPCHGDVLLRIANA